MVEAKKEWKPMFKADYTSQGTLINEIFPMQVYEIINFIKMIETGEDAIVVNALAWFAANMPPFKKFCPDYKELEASLEECRTLYKQWRKDDPQSKNFPITLKQKIFYLYGKWWEAYNDSGAGIRGSVYIPRDKRVEDAISNL